jgi:hypothetical protein
MISDSEPIIIEADIAVNTPFQSDLSACVDMQPASLWCRLRLHRWTKWGRVIIERANNGTLVIQERRYQMQTCLGCWARRERRVAFER